MDLDKLFKPHQIPVSQLGKRKLDAGEATEENLKKFKSQHSINASTTPSNVQNDEIDHQDFNDEEDDRFYGSGVSKHQQQIFDVVDQLDQEDSTTFDPTTVKKMVLKFEKAINKNQEMRMKYPNEPVKFMESEADLDEQIHGMMALVAAPERYPDLIKLGTISSLLQLLTHENPDIALACVELIGEMTDEEIVPEEDGEEQEEGVREFVEAFVKEQGLKAVVDNLSRLDESKDDDSKGIYNILSLIENFVSVDPKLADVIGAETDVLNHLLNTIRRKGSDATKQYSSEILSILLQDSEQNRTKLVELGGVDALLESVAQYKRTDPKDADEVEMVENLFASLCSVTSEPKAKQAFLDGQGFELMMIMMKEKSLVRMRALKVVDYCLTGKDDFTKQACTYWVENDGLEPLFYLFKKGKKLKHNKEHSELEEAERCVSVFCSLLRNLENIQPVLEGFDESSCQRLTNHGSLFRKRLSKTDKELKGQDLDEEDLELQRLVGGLLALQQTALILTHLLTMSEQRSFLTPSLQQHSITLDDIRQELEGFANNLGDEQEQNQLLSLSKKLK